MHKLIYSFLTRILSYIYQNYMACSRLVMSFYDAVPTAEDALRLIKSGATIVNYDSLSGRKWKWPI